MCVIGEITGLALLVCVWAESALRQGSHGENTAYEHDTGIALPGNNMTMVVCKET